jgi:hypothetical protein
MTRPEITAELSAMLEKKSIRTMIRVSTGRKR